jgi:hypothetical protein
MVKTFAEQLREDRRLALLRVLAEQPGKSMNSSNLDKWLRHIQITGTRADTLDALRWLHDQALLRLAPVADIDGLYIATLTGAGQDIASGRALHPGVAEPSPR